MNTWLEILNRLSGLSAKEEFFTMDAEEVEKSKDLIQCTCEVNDKVLLVLFDSGASHSFISCDFMSTL